MDQPNIFPAVIPPKRPHRYHDRPSPALLKSIILELYTCRGTDPVILGKLWRRCLDGSRASCLLLFSLYC
jgi:hypothetical protein